MPRTTPAKGEFYHVYNRGTDKRRIFSDQHDLERFFQSIQEFNTVDPIGSIYENSFKENNKGKKLVSFVTFCLLPNHFHFILQGVTNNGISEFMKRLGGGYTWYFNNKHNRTGSLFQGKYKAKHISGNNYLLLLSAYINLNYKIHQLGGPTAKLVKSSWDEYLGKEKSNFCEKKIILDQFDNIHDYKNFCRESLKDTQKKRTEEKELERLLLE